MTDRATLYGEAAQALKALAAAEREAVRKCQTRGAQGFETPRGRRVQSSIAWTAAAANRDRMLKLAIIAIERAGLAETEGAAGDGHYEIGSGGYNPP